MKQETFAPPEYREGLEADAVCGQCGSVNPEGTLICKTCGNNLRDQRLMRLAADQMLETEREPNERSPFLFRALTILGLLIVLWLGLNAGRLTTLLTTVDYAESEQATYARPSLFWSGEQHALFDELHTALVAQFPTETEAEAVRLNAAPTDAGMVDGRYVLFERLGTGTRFVGAASVQIERDTVFYVAVLTQGVEIRGQAAMHNNTSVSSWDDAGATYDEEYFALSGTAILQPDGSLDISGHSDHNTVIYQARAYRQGSL